MNPNRKIALADDESRLARYENLTAEEKAKVRAQQQAELKAAEAQRTRPLSSRALDVMYETFGGPEKRAATQKAAAEDVAQRQRVYNAAKSRADMSDADLSNESRLYGTDRKVKIEDNPTGMKKGGVVSASRRADGIAQRGKTRGKFV